MKYTKDHSWVKTENNIITLGITDAVATKENEFVFIQLPEKNKEIKKGETYVTVEAAKWSGHLTCPASGKVLEVNEDLFDEPSLINENPFENWICKIEIENQEELNDLLDEK